MAFVSDVDQRSREQWLVDDAAGSVTLVDINPAQSELGSKAYRVDAGSGFKRTFFHVSEIDPQSNRLTTTPNTNESATFEFWVRADSLADGQLLLETGGADRGLSISLGNADGDGQFNDIRLYAADLGAGRSIGVTASLADTNITEEFVQIVAVIAEGASSTSQTASIYLNGQLAAENSTVIGGGTVDWDGTNEAGLAMMQGALGGASGPGQGAFSTNGFAGEITLFSFFNYALTAAEIEGRFQFDYDFTFGDLDGDGILGQGDVEVFREHWLADTSLLGPGGRHGLGDLDSDGQVALADWILLRQAFLSQGLVAPVFSAVPEAPAWHLTGLFGLAAIGCRVIATTRLGRASL